MQTTITNEVRADNPELVARFWSDPYLSWIIRFCEFEEQCAVPEFHLEMSEDLRKFKRNCFKAPRSFAKSSHATRGVPLWVACEHEKFLKMEKPPIYPHKNILIIGGGYDLAIENLAWIKGEIEDNEDLIGEYGDLRGDKWGEKLIYLNNGVKIRAIGAGAKIRGYRPTLVVGDDLDDDEEVLNADIRAKNESWFDKVIINLLDKNDAQCFVIGTDIHPLSLLNHIYNKPRWNSKTFKAYEPDGKPLWPSKWPAEKLEERRDEIGDIAFRSEFMNEPIISENPVFLKEWFQPYEQESESFEGEKGKGLYIVTACDPAISKRDEADYTGIVTLGATFDKEGKIFVLDVRRGHWSLRNTVTQLFSVHDTWKQRRTVLETTAYQEALADEIRHEQEAYRKNVGVSEVKPDKDKERRAHAISSIVQDGRVYFDGSDRMQQKLMEELMLFPTGDHDDLVDAFVYCLHEIRDWNGRSTDKKAPTIIRSVRPELNRV